ncbi:MAG: hypothetical protein RQ756_05385 [Flavobacteriaceae bacterium]|nr:hypothetical protein [Flavobacteriaceae bacterium]
MLSAKKIVPLFVLLFALACNQPKTTSVEATKTPLEQAKLSEAYVEYAAAIKRLEQNRQKKAELTQDYVDQKLDEAAFSRAIEINIRSVQLLEQIVNSNFSILKNEQREFADQLRLH